MQFSAVEIAKIIRGKLVGVQTLNIDHFETDSRNIYRANDAAFFALKGQQHNGEKFIPDAYTSGVALCVGTQAALKYSLPAGSAYIQVNNTRDALQLLAAHFRKTLTGTVLSLTGSNGKTTVKEWLYQLVKPEFSTSRSPKSYNSQIGVPLSVLQLNPKAELFILEAGISQKGEMQKLADILQPRVGIFTNIGDAHDAGFNNRTEKIREKLLLFKGVEVLIYCADHSELHNEIEAQKQQGLIKRTISWSLTGQTADVHIEVKNNHWKCTGAFTADFTLWQNGKADVENISHALITALYLGVAPTTLQKQLPQTQPLNMRLQQVEAKNNCLLFKDFYNADLLALQEALHFFNRQYSGQKKTAILSLPAENTSKQLVQEVEKLLVNAGINRVFGLGKNWQPMAKYPEAKFYPDTESFLTELPQLEFNNEGILLKGSRSYQFERIAQQLEKQQYQTVLTVNLKAMEENLRILREKLMPNTKTMAMVKAFSYGSGSFEVAQMLQYNRIDYLGIAYADEGPPLRVQGIHLPIMVMNPYGTPFDVFHRWKLQPNIFSLDLLKHWIAEQKREGVPQSEIHIELNTGMQRLGMEESDFPELIELLKEHSGIKVVSVFSHLAAADDPQKEAETLAQIALFKQWCARLEKATERPFLKHILNTPGVQAYPQHQMDMVRLGVGMYGHDPAGKSSFSPVIRMTSYVSQLRTVPAETGVSYGFTDAQNKVRTIAVVGAGYADGVSRKWSRGRGYVSIHNTKAPVVGAVCMDMCMVDVTHLNCRVGDEVVIIGEAPTLTEIAQWNETIPYEVLTAIGRRVKRVYVYE